MAPKRRSLRERDEHAIATTGPSEVLPGQTTIDLPDAPRVRSVTVQEVEVGLASRASSTSTPTPQRGTWGQRESARRLGIYFYPADFTAAKAAYLADWQAGGNADTFAAWIGAVLLDHAQLSPEQRADTALPARQGGGGSTRSFALPEHVHQSVCAAVVADQGVGRWVSASTWAGAALHTAVRVAQARAGGSLPAPPARLPNRLRG